MLMTMICSLAWNNLAFAWPQFALPPGPGSGLSNRSRLCPTGLIPRSVVLAASTLDGFGMVASSLCVLGHASGLRAAYAYPYGLPWVLAAVYSCIEHYAVGKSQGPHCPRFVGLSGLTITKVHYPMGSTSAGARASGSRC